MQKYVQHFVVFYSFNEKENNTRLKKEENLEILTKDWKTKRDDKNVLGKILI